MRNPKGYAVITGPSGVEEMDTFTCSHDNTVVHIKPGQDPSETGGMCKMCMKLICKKCVGKRCVPFEKKLQAMESKSRLMKSVGV